MAIDIGGIDLTKFAVVLKDFYLPAINTHLNNSNYLRTQIATDTESVSGKIAIMLNHIGGTSGIGDRKDAGKLPPPGQQLYKRTEVPMKYSYGRIQFTGPSQAASRDLDGAWLQALDSEMKGIMDDLAREQNRKLAGNGYGCLARWRTTESATSYTVSKKYIGDTTGTGYGSAFGAKYFRRIRNATPVVCTFAGGVCTVAVVDTTDINVSAIAKSKDYDTITVTDPDVTEADGTFYVRLGNFAGGEDAPTLDSGSDVGYGRVEPMGIDGIVNDVNVDQLAFYDGAGNRGFVTPDPLQAVDATTNDWWKSVMFDHPNGRFAGQRALDLDEMQEMVDTIDDNVGKTDLSIITSKPIVRAYVQLLEARRRIVNEMKLDGGYMGISFNGIPVVGDRDAVDGRMYFLTLSDIVRYSMAPGFNWMDKDGSIFQRVLDRDAYEATLFSYYEVGTKRRLSHGCINDISYSIKS